MYPATHHQDCPPVDIPGTRLQTQSSSERRNNDRYGLARTRRASSLRESRWPPDAVLLPQECAVPQIEIRPQRKGFGPHLPVAEARECLVSRRWTIESTA